MPNPPKKVGPFTATITLDMPDYTLLEPGCLLDLSSPRMWKARTNATDTVIQEEKTFHIMLGAKTDFSDIVYPDAALGRWSLGGTIGHWEILDSIPGLDYHNAVIHRNNHTTRSKATTAKGGPNNDGNWDYNPSCMVGCYLYQPGNAYDNHLELSFGTGTLKIRFYVNSPPVVVWGGQEFVIPKAGIITPEQMFHSYLRFQIAFVRDKMVVYSNFMDPWVWCQPASEARSTWVDDNGEVHTYIIPRGTFYLEANGMFIFNAVPFQWELAGEFLIPFELNYTPTEIYTFNSVQWENYPSTLATIDIMKSDGVTPWEVGDYQGCIKVTLSSDDGLYTPMIRHMGVSWPTVTQPVEGTMKNVEAEVIDETRTLTIGSDQIRLRVRNDGTYDPNFHLKANRRVSVAIGINDGTGYVDVQRMTGYIESRSTKEDNQEWFDITIVDGMRRLRNCILGTDFRADGLTIEDAIQGMIERAGVPSNQIFITPTGFTMPDNEDLIEPACMYNGLTYIFDAVHSLIQEFLPDWSFYCDPDGNYIAEPPSQGESMYDFMLAKDIRPPDYNPDEILRNPLEEWVDDAHVRNVIWVCGLDANNQKLWAIREDPDGWLDPDYANYIGEMRIAIWNDPTLTTQLMVDTVADQLSVWFFKLNRYTKWRALYDPYLFPGHDVTIESIGRVKITDMESHLEKGYGETDYTGVFLGEA